MKRFLIFPLCLLLLLTGCKAVPQELPTTPAEPAVTTAPTAPATLPTELPVIPLLDQAESAGEAGNLLYIPNAHVESMACPEIRLYGNGLLLFEHNMENLQLKRISLEDGSLEAEATYAVTPSVRLQIGSGFIGLCDSGTGQVLILNEFLELETTYTVPMEGESWCLDQEMENLYVFYEEQGLLIRNLLTGETRWLLENAAFVQTCGLGNGYALFSYTDRADQKTYNRCLNLSTATLETLPVAGHVRSGVRSGDQWLLRQDYLSGEHILVSQDTASRFVRSEGLVELLSGRRQLLITDGSYRTLYLYDLSGKFLSRCDLPQIDYASVGQDLVWSGYWQGYFFRDTYDNTAHLMFWNPEVPLEGEDLPLTDLGAVQSPESILDQALYQKAQTLSQQFGLDIRIAEQCSLAYTHYIGDALAEPYFVREALNTLEQALSAYPEGFFRQLPYDSMQEIRIELAGDLRARDDVDTHPVDIGGFAQATSDHYLIVLDGTALQITTVFHEISHIIDKRLEWNANLQTDALFSEETWQSLQPSGFRYAESYIDIPALEHPDYFVRAYSTTFPTEDRATLMALAMTDSEVLLGNGGMLAKMRYYAACIRDCFDTTAWPETTRWEQALS